VLTLYGINVNTTRPFQLHFIDFHGPITDLLQSSVPGFDSWLVKKSTEGLQDGIFPRPESVVYLSPDSESDLTHLEPDTVYCIGGLVDRQRQKFVTQNRAQHLSIKTAKLPIRNHIRCNGRDTVLTLCDVVQLLCDFAISNDWREVFQKYYSRLRIAKKFPQTNQGSPDGEQTNEHSDSEGAASEKECEEKGEM